MVSILTVGIAQFIDLFDPSRLTERTPDNQLLGTSKDTNITTCVAKHPTLKSQLD